MERGWGAQLGYLHSMPCIGAMVGRMKKVVTGSARVVGIAVILAAVVAIAPFQSVTVTNGSTGTVRDVVVKSECDATRVSASRETVGSRPWASRGVRPAAPPSSIWRAVRSAGAWHIEGAPASLLPRSTWLCSSMAK